MLTPRGDTNPNVRRRPEGGATIAPVGPGGDVAREGLLVARVVAGDETALALVYEDWSPYVFTLALRVCRDASMAEDVTQEVFVHFWERADGYDPARATLRTWLGMLTHRRCVDRIRREEARRQREDRDHRRTPAVGDVVEDDALHAVTSEHLARALADLPVEQRACVTLAYFQGQTFKEVAVTLGIPEGTAKSRIRLALAKLADAMEGSTAWT